MFQRIISVVLVNIFLVGCTTFSSYHYPENDTNLSVSIQPTQKLSLFAALAEIAYRDTAPDDFKNMGFNVSYFYVKPWRFFLKYPEIFILSSPKLPNQMLVIVVGSNSYFDWIQNFKYFTYSDTKTGGYFYIPTGHAGFRRAAIDLIHMGFFENGLRKHQSKYGLRSKQELTLIGHSQGGGVAQMITPYLAGYRYEDGLPTLDNSWNYTLNNVVTIGSPMAVSRDSWEFMQNTFGRFTLNIIRDGDLVSAASKPKDKSVENFFYGKYLRITRDGEAKYEDSRWGIDDRFSFDPHGITTYLDALNRFEDDKDTK